MIARPRFTLTDAEVANASWGDHGVGYRVVPEFPLYAVGDDGSLWSCHWARWRKLRPRFDKHGYVCARLCRDGKHFYFKIHCLVMALFIGPRPQGHDIAHNDGNPRNARLSNLRYDTHKGNHADRRRHGTSNAGSKNGMSKLTEDQVMDIRRRVRSGEDKYVVAIEFQLSRRGVRRILSRERWAHVED